MRELMNSCQGLISMLTSHVNGLTKLLMELPTKDHPGAVSLRSSLIKSLTALAEMHDHMSSISHEPIATDHRQRCIAALMRAIEVIHSLAPEDFTIIGVFFGV